LGILMATVVYETEKDPDAVLSYIINWASEDGTNDGSANDSGWLQGDTITASTWTVPAGITEVSDTFTSKTTKLVASGGTADQLYVCTNHITTTAGLQEDRILIIRLLPAQSAAIISTTAYTTTAEADAVLLYSSKWTVSTSSQKANALKWARIYFDDVYDTSLFDSDEPPSIVKEANAILADEHLKKDLWTYQDPDESTVSSTSVSAGAVSSSKSYDTSKKHKWKDPFPYVTALVVSLCSIKKGSGSSIIYVMRG